MCMEVIFHACFLVLRYTRRIREKDPMLVQPPELCYFIGWQNVWKSWAYAVVIIAIVAPTLCHHGPGSDFDDCVDLCQQVTLDTLGVQRKFLTLRQMFQELNRPNEPPEKEWVAPGWHFTLLSGSIGNRELIWWYLSIIHHVNCYIHGISSFDAGCMNEMYAEAVPDDLWGYYETPLGAVPWICPWAWQEDIWWASYM